MTGRARKHGNCQSCGTPLDEQGFCWKCSGPEPAEVPAARRRMDRRPVLDRCIFRGSHGRCLLLASAELEGHGFCSWHFSCRLSGWHGGGQEDFEQWLTRRIADAVRYHDWNPWAAYSAQDWWRLVNGNEPEHAPLPSDYPKREQDRRCTKAENLAGIAACRAAVKGKRGPMAREMDRVVARLNVSAEKPNEEVPF